MRRRPLAGDALNVTANPVAAAADLTAAAIPIAALGFWRRALRHRSFVIGAVLALLLVASASLSLVWDAVVAL